MYVLRGIRLFFAGLMLALGMMAMAPTAFAQTTSPTTPAPALTPAEQAWQTIRDAAGATFGQENDDNTKKSLAQWDAAFSGNDCWGCRLFGVMAEVAMEKGQQGSDLFSASAISAVSAFMALWVTWQLFLMLSVSHANSPAQSIDTIFNRLIVMMVVLFLLSSNRPYTYIMQGVLTSLGDIMAAASGLVGGAQTCVGSGGSSERFITQGTGLLCAVHKQMSHGMALGAWMIDGATFNIFTGEYDILRIIGGAIIFAVFGFMLIIMPFRFFDALVRIATVAVIMPIVILAYLFKPTRGAVKQAATSLLAAALTFLFTAIAVAIAMAVFERITAPIFVNVSGGGYDNGQKNAIGPMSGPDFMILIATALGMATMILQAGNLAQEFAGFQGQMGSAGAAGAAAATGVVMLGAKAAGGVAGSAVTGAAGKAGGMVPSPSTPTPPAPPGPPPAAPTGGSVPT